MIRVLLMITVAGFVLSVGTLSAAVAIGGPEAIARGGWNFASGEWGDRWWHGGSEVRRGDGDWSDEWSGHTGKQATRTLDWSGADRLDIDLAADVRYVQAAGAGSVEVTGPERLVDRVVVRGDSIRYRNDTHRRHTKLSIVVRAPNVSSFDISGRSTLALEGYRQDRLSLDVSGSAEVTATTGEAEEINLDVSGSGDVDLGALRAKGANADISGSADATLSPSDWARLEISGMGDVRLLTRPERLETDISGSGKVRQGEAPSPSPSPSPSPTPSPSPSPKGAKL